MDGSTLKILQYIAWCASKFIWLKKTWNRDNDKLNSVVFLLNGEKIQTWVNRHFFYCSIAKNVFGIAFLKNFYIMKSWSLFTKLNCASSLMVTNQNFENQKRLICLRFFTGILKSLSWNFRTIIYFMNLTMYYGLTYLKTAMAFRKIVCFNYMPRQIMKSIMSPQKQYCFL